MSNVLGIVKAVIGLVYVVEPDGSQRILKEGDRIYTGEEVITSNSGAVSLSLPNGKTVDIGRGSHWTEQGLNIIAPAHSDTQDVAALQKAIADGADPTKTLEATAAGNEPPQHIEGGGGGHTVVQMELTGLVVDPTAGFKTTGIGEPVSEHDLPVGGLQDTHASPIIPPLVNIDFFAGNDGYVNRDETQHTDIKGTSNKEHVVLVFTDSQNHTLTFDVPVVDGRWETHLDLSHLAEGKIAVEAIATDVAGRVARSTTSAIIDVTGPQDTINIHTIAGDNVVNSTENRMATHITGDVGGDAQLGDRVVLHIQGQDYISEVIKGVDGKLGYSIDVPVGGLKEGDNTIDVTVYSQDKAGNVASAHTQTHVLLDTHAKAGITIDDVTHDNTLNFSELSAEKQTITGLVGGDAKLHDTVYITLGTHTYYGSVEMIDGQLGYKITDVDSSAFSDNQGHIDKDVTFTVSVISTDEHGNQTIATTQHKTHIDNHAENAITFKTVASDDTVNRNESRMPTLIHGEVSGVDAKVGDDIVVTSGNHTYYGKVVMDNGHLSYSVFIPGNDLKEGANDVHVKVISHDNAGNEAVAEQHRVITLDTHANATITIDKVTNDNTLNRDELYQDKQIVSGTVGGDARPGDIVTLDIHGHRYTGIVDSKFHYHIEVDSSAFAVNDKNIDERVNIVATVTAFDGVQNEVIQSTSSAVQIDNHADASITVNNLAGDDIINAVESEKTQIVLSGVVNGDVHINDIVHLTVNGHLYEAIVKMQSNGLLGYSVAVKTDDLMYDNNHQLLTNPHIEAMVIAYDKAGNAQIIPVTHSYQIDLHADASITIDPITVNQDNIINAVESQQELTVITGSVGGDVKPGDIVHLFMTDPSNGKVIALTGTVDKNHHYSISVSTSDLMDHPDIRVEVDGTDKANNIAHAHAVQSVAIDTQVDANITIDNVTPDNTLNTFEQGRERTRVSGTVSGEAKIHDHVQLLINGHIYQGEVERLKQGGLGYRIMVNTSDLDANPNIHASLVHHLKDTDFIDGAGNHKDVFADNKVILDSHADATITINIISGDDVLNRVEQEADKTIINGYLGGDVKKGDIVHILVDGRDYKVTAEPQAYLNGALGYSLEVLTSELLEDSTIRVKVHTTDGAGNPASAFAERTVQLDDHANARITIDPVTGDNLIKGDEANNETTTITGQITGDVNVGDPVDLLVNGQHYHGKVEQGDHGPNSFKYSIEVSTVDLMANANPELKVSVLGHDLAGNTYLARATDQVEVGSRVTVDDFHADATRDYYIITGHVGGTDVKLHDCVEIKVGDHIYYTEVITLPDGKLGYNFNKMSPTDVNGNHQVTVQVDSHTLNGTPDTGIAQINYTLSNSGINFHSGDPTTQPQNGSSHVALTISPVAGNDVIDKAESESNETVVRGTVTGDVHPGDIVILTIGAKTYRGNVVERPNLPGEYEYEISVDTKWLIAHPEIHATLNENTSDHRDIGKASREVSHDLTATATLHLDNIAGDKVINIAESHSGKTTVTGTVSGDVHVGSIVTLTVNGQILTTTVFKDDKTGELRFSKDVSIDDLRQDPHLIASITGVDDQGNTHLAQDRQDITVDTTINAGIKIDDIAHHNILNASDLKTKTTDITGTVTGDVHPKDHVTVIVHGHEYDGVIDENMHFSVPVDTLDLIAGKDVYVEVNGYDNAQNTLLASDTKKVSIDKSASATITINTVAGDDILTAAELHSKMTEVTGRVGGDARIGDTVIVTVNGVPSTAQVEMHNGILVYHAEVLTHDLLVNPTITARVVGHDDAGNPFSTEAEPKTLTIDDHAFVLLAPAEISGDNVLNLAESKEGKTPVRGMVYGDVKEGDVVVIHVNGSDIVAQLHATESGGFSFEKDVDTIDLLQGKTVTYTVVGTDPLGNVVTVMEQQVVNFDPVAKAQIFTDEIAGDGYINQQEYKQDKTLVTGRVGKDAHIGDNVTVMVNGQPFYGKVTEEKHHLVYQVEVTTSVLHEGVNDLVATINVMDAAGNPATAEYTSHVTVDTKLNGDITLNAVGTKEPSSNQEVINQSQYQSDHITLSGTLTGDITDKDLVTILVNGHKFTTPVVMENGHLVYKIDVDKSYFHEGDNTVNAIISIRDEAGNTKTVEIEPRVITLDTHADATIAIDKVTGDNHLSRSELHHEKIHITGTIEGDVHAKDDVIVKIGEQTYTGHLHNVDGHLTYDISVDSDNFHRGLNDVTVTVNAKDEHGNTTSLSKHVDVTVPPNAHHGHHTEGAQLHGLHNLVDQSHQTLSFAPPAHQGRSGHPGNPISSQMAGEAGHNATLKALYHELHHDADITHMIKGNNDGTKDSQPAQHVKAEPVGAPLELNHGHDGHNVNLHSLDHLLGKLEHHY